MTKPGTPRRTAINYRDLDVWNIAMELVVDVYALSKAFPRDELFGLTAQSRKAAVSIPTNIAEGKGRFGAGEYRHFVSIASGSAAELETELEIAERLGFVSAQQLAGARTKLSSILRMLTNVVKSLQS